MYLKKPVMYPILEPAGAWILGVPGRCFAVFVLVVVERVLFHRFGALEEPGFFEPELVRILVVEVFQQATLQVIGAPDVQCPLLTETRQLVDAPVGRGTPLDF